MSPSFPSFLLFKTSNSIFLTFASSQVLSVGRTYPPVSEPPSVGVVCTHACGPCVAFAVALIPCCALAHAHRLPAPTF